MAEIVGKKIHSFLLRFIVAFFSNYVIDNTILYKPIVYLRAFTKVFLIEIISNQLLPESSFSLLSEEIRISYFIDI